MAFLESNDDLATLSELNDDIILNHLKDRFAKEQIYTYVGDILVAVNPYRKLSIYGKEFQSRYRGAHRSDHPPHIYAISDNVYQRMIQSSKLLDQCILISGESGAGKTESTKLLIQHIVELSKGNRQIEQQIVQVNPLLEAFGNACTLMNDNSSRFGRFIQLKFVNGQVVGSKISEYLLEKSRVVRQNRGEENFHIFYYLFCDENKKASLKLKEPKNYRYLSNGASVVIKAAASDELFNALDMVGFTDAEQNDLLQVLVAILNLGNIDFAMNDKDESHVTNESREHLHLVMAQLGVDIAELEGILTSSRTFTRGEEVKKNYNKVQSQECRDALAKTLYGRLFSWIIHKINTVLSDVRRTEQPQEIGILDIFGFEHFDLNSFEQFCINIANEQLQYFFNKHVFLLEQEEYRREGIDWTEIQFIDNSPVLKLFLDKPSGIFEILDEESKFPNATDQTFVDKVTRTHESHPQFKRGSRGASLNFAIVHYAAVVMYNGTGWLDKNRDTVGQGTDEMLQEARNQLVNTMFKGKLTRTGTLAFQNRTSKRTTKHMAQRALKEAKERKITVGGQFKNSLAVLLERMTRATPVFIRCIKPNNNKMPSKFDDDNVLTQLHYTGLLQTTKIRRDGYAIRPTFSEFTTKYRFLLFRPVLEASQENCRKILENCRELTNWKIGKTRVFLKYRHLELLDRRIEEVGKQVVHIQKIVRGFLGRVEVRRRKEQARKARLEVDKLLKDLETRGMAETLRAMTIEDKHDHETIAVPAHEFPPLPEIVTPIYDQPIGVETHQQEPSAYSLATGVDSDSEDVAEDIFEHTVAAAQFGAAGTREASVRWFKETQINKVKNDNGGFETWFHGIITRKQSESLLAPMAVGQFLVRVSESRFGYTLSFKAQDRCRHYMIDQLQNGRFIIIGEPKVHRSLRDLVKFHREHTLSNWSYMLTDPVGQTSEECDYIELIRAEMYSNDTTPMKTIVPVVPPRSKASNGSSTSSMNYVRPPVPDRNYSRGDIMPRRPAAKPTGVTYMK